MIAGTYYHKDSFAIVAVLFMLVGVWLGIAIQQRNDEPQPLTQAEHDLVAP